MIARTKLARNSSNLGDLEGRRGVLLTSMTVRPPRANAAVVPSRPRQVSAQELPHDMGAETGTGVLDCVVARADPIFLVADSVHGRTQRRVETCCGCLERIVLDEGNLSAVEQALRTWNPLVRL